MSDKDIIYRQDAIKYFTELWECIGTISNREEWEDVCVTTVSEIKSAEPERKKGKWIQPCDITGFGRCSNCNALWDNSLIENRYFRYCPRCGADMREGEEE